MALNMPGTVRPVRILVPVHKCILYTYGKVSESCAYTIELLGFDIGASRAQRCPPRRCCANTLHYPYTSENAQLCRHLSVAHICSN